MVKFNLINLIYRKLKIICDAKKFAISIDVDNSKITMEGEYTKRVLFLSGKLSIVCTAYDIDGTTTVTEFESGESIKLFLHECVSSMILDEIDADRYYNDMHNVAGEW